MKEIWKAIDINPIYEVSNKGRIRSWYNGRWARPKTPRILKTNPRGKCPYCAVRICIDGIPKSQYVHRLVLLAFVGAPPTAKSKGLHWDDDASNNSSDNLRWGTQKQNYADSVRNKGARLGENAANRKLTEKDVLEIRKIYKPGKKPSQQTIANQHGVNQVAISCIITRKSWKHI